MSSLIRNVKNLSLGLLVLQNTSLVLLMRHTLDVNGPVYMSSTVVALGEVLKLVVCLTVVYMQSGESRTFLTKLRVEVVERPLEMAKLMVPALIYTVQNNLVFIALANLDAATYSVCYQTKILTTALFSVVLLKKRLTLLKWGALVLLAAGVALAKMSDPEAQVGDDKGTGSTDSIDSKREFVQSPLLGFLCVMATSVTSGFAGVYFEMVLKGSKTSLWIRNVQMGVPSIVLAFVSVVLRDWREVTAHGFFFGYNWRVAGVIFLQAMGGLVVAVVVRYADNIRKTFAAAVSIITSCILSILFFDFQPNRLFIVGVVCVCLAVHMYSRPGKERPMLPLSHSRPVAFGYQAAETDRRRSYTSKV